MQIRPDDCTRSNLGTLLANIARLSTNCSVAVKVSQTALNIFDRIYEAFHSGANSKQYLTSTIANFLFPLKKVMRKVFWLK
ncbi:hypothetical protein AHF37_08196 [Paragonimus kellicotti]|nr:hypothetical protein AHF37_08196 [Paragonimus kellicotti]